jgi:hypothetical protein
MKKLLIDSDQDTQCNPEQVKSTTHWAKRVISWLKDFMPQNDLQKGHEPALDITRI